MTKQVKLYNKGKSIIHGHHSDTVNEKTGLPKAYAFMPDTAGSFDESEAKKLRRLYPNHVISMEDVKKQFADDSPADNEPMISVSKAEQIKQDAIEAAVKEAIANYQAENAGTASDKETGEDTGTETDNSEGEDKPRGRGRPAKK